jgi:hypothetical protein
LYKKLKQSSVAIGTVFYPKAKKYIKRFLINIGKQDFKNFDLIVINESVKVARKNTNKFNILFFKSTKNINKNRIKLINIVKKLKYKKLIFCDVDDTFSNNRFRIVTKKLDDFKLVFNDVNLVRSNNKKVIKNFFSKRIKKNKKIFFKDILNYNFCGLSNSALRVNLLKNINLNIFAKAPIFDWALFSILLTKNYGVFVNTTKTIYNCGLNRETSLPLRINKNNYLSIAKKKKSHYDFLKKCKMINFKKSKFSFDTFIHMKKFPKLYNQLWWET